MLGTILNRGSLEIDRLSLMVVSKETYERVQYLGSHYLQYRRRLLKCGNDGLYVEGSHMLSILLGYQGSRIMDARYTGASVGMNLPDTGCLGPQAGTGMVTSR